MLVAPYNDIDSLTSILDEHADDIAAIIVEPLQRVIPAAPGFLQAIRDECTKRGIVLIFDEVVTGFRFSYGGAQELYGVTPDICTMGKLIGGGFALAAIAGNEDIMSHFDLSKAGKDGFLMQVGTLSGNPVAAAAGLKSPRDYASPRSIREIVRQWTTHHGCDGETSDSSWCATPNLRPSDDV